MPNAVTLLSMEHFPIPGTPLHVHEELVHVQHRLLHFWGLRGAGLVNGQRKQRVITVRHIIHQQYSEPQINAVKDTYAAQAGRTGTLRVVAPNRVVTFKHCLYLGWEALPDPADGPLPDAAGTLDGGWWQTLIFAFTQITTNP